ncbi:MAG TPA: DUF6541 family protein [Pseudonocardiaceae bacterium]|nr:DUF6541 family protein [Pseudonocardiaceae bacterium]
MRDVLVLLVALLVCYLPGLALMAALGVRSGVLLIGLAPAATVGVATVTGAGTALLGVRFGPRPLGLLTAAMVVVATALPVLRRLAHRSRRKLPAAGRLGHGRLGHGRLGRGRLGQVAGVVLVAGGALTGALPWLRGIGPLSTVPQEHDMVVHAVLSAYIQRSGHAAPWQLMPADVLSGTPVSFYPSGLHLLAAVTGGLTGATVPALNAVTVVLLAVGLAGSAAALTVVAARQLGLAPATAMLAAGVAVLVAAGLYRPAFQLMHDGGVLANSAALALAPGVIAGVLALPHLPRTSAIAAGVACAGVVSVHPSATASVGVTVIAWWAGQALTPDGRARLRGQRGSHLIRLLITAGTAAVLASGTLIAMLPSSGRTASWPPDTLPVPFGDAVGSTIALAYGGYLDPQRSKGQAVAAVLVALGVLAVVALRRGFGVVTAWAAWSLVTIGTLLSPGTGPVSLVTGFFYHAHARVWSHVSLLAPVLAGLGVVLTANWCALWLRRHGPVPARPAAALLVVLAWLGYLAGPAARYADTNTTAVAARYRSPEFVRVGADDQRAITWLAEHIRPGERVLNSPNDGSTYLYVERGIPVLNVVPLGLDGVPYSYQLLRSFRFYPADERIRDLLRRYHVAWVYVDSSAPVIGSSVSPQGWAGTELFTLAPGLAELTGLPGLTPTFTSGSVTVYSLDLGALRAVPRRIGSARIAR